MALDLTNDAPAAGDATDILAALAAAVSIRELDEALGAVADVARRAVGAASAAVVLVEDHRLRVVPTRRAADGKRRGTVEITLDPAPAVAEVLERPGPVVVVDASTSPAAQALVPAAVPPGAVTVVLAPMRGPAGAVGVLAASWETPVGGALADQAAKGLGALAATGAVLVCQADAIGAAHRWVQAQEVLTAAAVALAEPLPAGLVTARLADAYTELLNPRLCVVGVLDEGHDNLVAVAARGTRKVRGSLSLSDVPRPVVRRLCREWAADAHPVEVGDERWLADVVGGRPAGARWYQLVPLSVDGRVAGAVVLGFGDGRHLDDDDVDAALVLAEVGEAALARHAARDRQTQRAHELDVVGRMATAFVDAADRNVLLARVREILADDGIELVGLSYRDQRLARRLGSDEPTPEEEVAWRSRMAVPLADGTLAVPLRIGQRPVGTLRVRPAEPTAGQRTLLDTVAGALADLSARRSMRLALEEADRERALKDERDRLALDLHDTAGQLFVAIRLLADQDDDSGRRMARVGELAEQGKWELDQAVRALAFVPSTRHGLVPAVRALSRSLSADSGIEVLVEVNGRPTRLAPKAERALYRVAHEALTNAWRHARCAVVRVEIGFTAGETTLRVVDDGVGLILRQGTDPGHLGLTGMRRALAEVEGSLRIRNARPRGVAIEARVARTAGAG